MRVALAPDGMRLDDSRPSLRVTAIVPATNAPATLPRCLHAIESAEAAPEEIVVVRDASIAHISLARNAGARGAAGDVLVFVDADVTVHHDAFARVRRAFEADPELAALFGSYDDEPAAADPVSFFRNLLHHHVHQCAPGRASTFWTGLGAIRRDVFEAAGGFAVHSCEDIELGMRLFEGGARIVLDPNIQGKHLKRWSLWGMLRTDLLVRGIPWVGLVIERPATPATALNLGWRHRASAAACLALLAAILFLEPLVAIASLATIVSFNFSFYRLLARKGGLRRAAVGVALHCLHLWVAALALPLGVLRYMAQRREHVEWSGRYFRRVSWRAIRVPAVTRRSRSLS